MEFLHKITSFTNYFYDLSTFLSSVILDVVFLEILNGIFTQNYFIYKLLL